MSFWEIFDFQCIYLTKLEYRTSLESLRTFIMIRDDMILCRCTYSSKWNICQSLSLPWAFSISVRPIKKNKLTWTVPYSNKALINIHHDTPNSHAPGKLPWVLGTYSFENKLSMQNMPYRICRKLPLFLVINIWFGYS